VVFLVVFTQQFLLHFVATTNKDWMGPKMFVIFTLKTTLLQVSLPKKMASKGGAPSEQIKVFVRMRKLLKRELGSSAYWKCDEKGDFRNEIW
jgi:hypothetical protein